MTKIDPYHVLDRVKKALDSQFELYSWEQMINDCDLDDDEKAWAKENITYRAELLPAPEDFESSSTLTEKESK